MRYIALALLLITNAYAVDVTTGLLSPTTTTPSTAGSQSFTGSNNDLFCIDWAPMMGIVNATKLAWKIDGGSTTTGVAIYANGGTTELTETTNTGSGLRTVTGLSAFTMVAGTLYRTCWCLTSSSSYTAAAIRVATPGGDPIADMFNNFGNHVGVAANPCVAGDPPATTGALTPATGQAMIVYIAKE